jgi:ribosomal protein S27E
MEPGEKNRNNQELLKKTDKPSTTHPNAKIWVMRCGDCGNEYGCNSCDAHERQCPRCNRSVRPGEPIS